MRNYLPFILETNCNGASVEACATISAMQDTERALGAEPMSVESWQIHCQDTRNAINNVHTQFSDETVTAMKAMNTSCPIRISQLLERLGVDLEAQNA